ncbi:hypothetical protein JCM17960_05870 [Magnetospira thiophila]
MSMSPFRPSAVDDVPTACFSVHASAEAGVMSRVMEVFAKRGMVPTTWYSTLRTAHSDDLQIDVQIRNVGAAEQAKLAAALRQVVGVEVVLTADKRPLALTA